MPARTICLPGFPFLWQEDTESEKTVLLPDACADCPMAHMAQKEKIRQLRQEYPDLAVVCYINSTAELKTESDVRDFANAVKIVRELPNANIYFYPDQNLGAYVRLRCRKNVISTKATVRYIKRSQRNRFWQPGKVSGSEAAGASECTPRGTELADMVGSTSRSLPMRPRVRMKISDRHGKRRLWRAAGKIREKPFIRSAAASFARI